VAVEEEAKKFGFKWAQNYHKSLYSALFVYKKSLQPTQDEAAQQEN
jgi:hypothetical protein